MTFCWSGFWRKLQSWYLCSTSCLLDLNKAECKGTFFNNWACLIVWLLNTMCDGYSYTRGGSRKQRSQNPWAKLWSWPWSGGALSKPHTPSALWGRWQRGAKDAQKACVCSLDASAKCSYNILPQTGKPNSTCHPRGLELVGYSIPWH